MSAGAAMAIAIDPFDFARRGSVARVAAAITAGVRRHVRLTAILSLLVICACFAAATVLQMRRDYAHDVALAGSYAAAEAQMLAGETARTLERLAALGAAFSEIADKTGAGYLIEAAEAGRVLNVAVAEGSGSFAAAMKGDMRGARPLPLALIGRLARGPLVQPFADPAIGSSPLTLIFRGVGERVLVMPLDPSALLPRAAVGQTALFTPHGLTLALGPGWEQAPPSYVLRTEEGESLRYLQMDSGDRIIALAPVPGWPLAVASSTPTEEALQSWHANLPLYVFIILGPGMVGAALAILIVGAFERAERARSALVAIKAIDDRRTAERRGSYPS